MRASDAIDIKAAFERMDPVMTVTFFKVALTKDPQNHRELRTISLFYDR